MNTKTFLTIAALLLGEVVIVLGFILLLGPWMPTSVLVLDIIVSTIIYFSFFGNVFTPLVDFKDRSQRKVGVLGVRWTTIWIYAILAIAVMVVGFFVPLSFTIQILAQLLLLFILIMGIVSSISVAEKTADVYQSENLRRNSLEEVKRVMRQLSASANMSNAPDDVRQRIDALTDAVRYLSPSDSQEALAAENYIRSIASELAMSLRTDSNSEYVLQLLSQCETSLQERKKLY